MATPHQDVIDRARAAWPELELDEAGFAAHVEALREGADTAELYAGDLWLAYGCAVGNDDAVAAFDREVLSQTGMLLGRMQPTPQLIDDVRQALRDKLLVAAPGAGRFWRGCAWRRCGPRSIFCARVERAPAAATSSPTIWRATKPAPSSTT